MRINWGLVTTALLAFAAGMSWLLIQSSMAVSALYLSPCMVIMFYNYPILLILLWLVLGAVDILFPFTPVGLYGFSFQPMDVAYFFTLMHLLILVFARPSEVWRAIKENKFLSLFLLMIAVYIVLYTPVYGKSAIGEARKFYFYFLFPLLMMVTLKKPKYLDSVYRVVVALAVFLSVIGLFRLLPGDGGFRSINASSSLFLTFAAFGILIFHMNKIVVFSRIVDGLLVVAFFSLVVITQHRSVWLATASGLVLLFAMHRERLLLWSKAVLIGMVALGVLAAAMMDNARFSARFQERASGIVDPYSDKTASWRIKRWEEERGRIMNSSPLFGEGLGGYYEGKPEGGAVGYSPHNAYVQMVLKFGFFGLILYGLLVFDFFRKTLHVRRKLPSGPVRAYVEMGILNFGAAHAYMVAYGLQLPMLIFVALALSAARLQRDSWLISRPEWVRNAREGAFAPRLLSQGDGSKMMRDITAARRISEIP